MPLGRLEAPKTAGGSSGSIASRECEGAEKSSEPVRVALGIIDSKYGLLTWASVHPCLSPNMEF